MMEINLHFGWKKRQRGIRRWKKNTMSNQVIKGKSGRVVNGAAFMVITLLKSSIRKTPSKSERRFI